LYYSKLGLRLNQKESQFCINLKYFLYLLIKYKEKTWLRKTKVIFHIFALI